MENGADVGQCGRGHKSEVVHHDAVGTDAGDAICASYEGSAMGVDLVVGGLVYGDLDVGGRSMQGLNLLICGAFVIGRVSDHECVDGVKKIVKT